MLSKLPKWLSVVAGWVVLAWVMVNIDPALLRDIGLADSYLPFWLLVSWVVWYTIAIGGKSATKAVPPTTTIVGGLLLSFWGLMHVGLVVVLGLTLMIESWYIYKQK